jgi:hypothetical protein
MSVGELDVGARCCAHELISRSRLRAKFFAGECVSQPNLLLEVFMFHDPNYVPLTCPLKDGWKGDLIQYAIDRTLADERDSLEAAPKPEELPLGPSAEWLEAGDAGGANSCSQS